ncbi:hypothetical protein ACFQY5_16685 [Paeniroseomonas aquatica]|uniref:Uncharacterized protein n=1 Tax=Paeniroseomonas aquatica TaxID=373043 RepID=A0ABT8AGI2_9PROT|nr:hypothetical protein [Paeniroseomonas aquatica]MDN3568648.1 hypothetical protein [Paeniroseomonas aquatica]
MSIAGALLVIPGLALCGAAGVGLLALGRRRQRTRTTAFAQEAFVIPANENLHGASDVPTIEAAEHQLGLVCRRMRAYLQDPYDFERSRIRDDAGFEQSLDLAASLSIRIGDLGGEAVAAGETAREQVRQQILEGLVNRVNLRRASRPPPDAPPGLGDALRA